MSALLLDDGPGLASLLLDDGVAEAVGAGGDFGVVAAVDGAGGLVELAADAFGVLIEDAFAAAFFHSGLDWHVTT